MKKWMANTWLLGVATVVTYMFNLYDAAATDFCIRLRGVEIELNPFAAWLWTVGPGWFWAFKVIVPALLLSFLFLVATGRLGDKVKLATYGLWSMLVAYFSLTIWHIYNFLSI